MYSILNSPVYDFFGGECTLLLVGPNNLFAFINKSFSEFNSLKSFFGKKKFYANFSDPEWEAH